MQPQHNANDAASRLKREWEARAQSESRDFFVASHPGWDDSVGWSSQARQDTAFLTTGLSADFLSLADVLELGCGVGRLAPELLKRVKSYTGVDVAPSMIVEAKRRLAGSERARFFESDGQSVPTAAQDRHYGFVIAHGVFIHCPHSVIEALVAVGWRSLESGGVIRFQLRADPQDFPADLPAATSAPAAAPSLPIEAATSLEPKGQDVALITEQYMGDFFTVPMAEQLLIAVGARDPMVMRVGPCHIYASAQKP